METFKETAYLSLLGLVIPDEDTMNAGLREVARGQNLIPDWFCFATRVLTSKELPVVIIGTLFRNHESLVETR